MKISYTVEVDEQFGPPAWGLAPSNFDPNIHHAMLVHGQSEKESNQDWAKSCTYVLRKKKVVKRYFVARTHSGGAAYLGSLGDAWKYDWGLTSKTNFVVESVYEDDILIDIIVHKDPPSKG